MSVDYTHVDHEQIHRDRARKILKAHPEVRTLLGPNPWTSVFIFSLVFIQISTGYLLADKPWWLILIVAYALGAFISHGLYVLVHEVCHNLVFKTPWINKLLGFLCDVGIGFPSSISFSKYHMIHHAHLGEYDYDPDIVAYWEGRLIGNKTWRKALWLCFFFLSQGFTRTPKVKNTKLMDGWVAANMISVSLVLLAIGFFINWWVIGYLLFSTFFALGLHPLGGRWLQEHYVFEEGQETYSYYGPLNWVGFNIGYHNEHHDLMNIPWNRTPKLRKMAPEFYNNLVIHKSLTKVAWDFITKPEMSPFSRIVHPSKNKAKA
ncbi:MAG: fatty acid desaturase [Bdellovibrionales bacterium CG12_big_fil_rev_8_21_14_0_65_38_15]|nr:MAG: fatty acid desaturase [Bdellovibrionales bacterium CG22_combo_CG10-13_8_21_14_all_38_13]PIQ55663.1 MAG: fatty acid desaturase [Bdellovibrionales bacterium CG12_big_fil_rev_8_21_14_0_65_38_15]PIR30673.1 MAG: fatty acid desaturase [Bdellovibrionales bacterium CG11_big_fil_rev_8_21_14_0_20_38_13]